MGECHHIRMGGSGSADACRTVMEQYYVDRRPTEHMDANTQAFNRCPFKFLKERFAAEPDSQTVSTTIAGRPCVFARGAAASQLFYDVGHQSHATTTHAPPECVQALLGKGTPHHSIALLHGDPLIARKQEVLRAFSTEALETYWAEIIRVMETYMESWIKRGTVPMAKELDDLSFEISARCFIGASDAGHIHKLRTIAGGA